MKRARQTVALAAAVLLLGAAGGATPDPATGDHLIQRQHRTMGTHVSISVWAEDDARAVRAIESAFAELDRIDRLMTTWLPDSDVSRVNAAAGNGEAIRVDPEVVKVVAEAQRVARKSGGAFDVTVGVYQGLWKFDQDKDGTLPAPADVSARVGLVRWQDVIVDTRRSTIRLRRKGQRMTLGGIAKGYGTDRAVAALHEAGFVHFIVQAGGDMYVSGRRGDRKWRVGIRDPRSARTDDFFAYVEVEDRTFSTSGDYERFVLREGKRYHHILDPKTGFPAGRSRSVTVMARDALVADALDTALFVMGPELGMKLVERLPEVEAVFVSADNRVTVSSGLADRIVIVRQPADGP